MHGVLDTAPAVAVQTAAAAEFATDAANDVVGAD